MKVLITGDRGFLGRHLTEEIRRRYPGSTIFVSNTSTNDLREPLANITDWVKLDYIYHLAAWTKAGDFCLKNPASQWMINQKINTNILSYWAEYQTAAKMVIMGTSCAYDPDLEKTVSNYGLGNVDPDLYSYAMTKRMLATGVKAFADQYGMRYQIWIPTTLCGTGFADNDNHFIFDIVRKICTAKKTGKPVVLWGDGYQKREVMFVEDAVKLILDGRHYENTTHNLSTGKELTIRDFANKISQLSGYNGEVMYDTTRFVGVRSKLLVPSIEYTPTDLDLVLTKMIDYVESNM
jgi:GDP-L-fucose synthase